MTLRVYADFNGLVAGPRHPGRTAVVLDTFGSLRELGIVGRSSSNEIGVRYVPAGDRSAVERFPC